MKLAASVLVIVLAGCASDGGSNPDPGGTNPPTLWLAMSSSDAMKLVGTEPHPY
jgi:hypothetical protein